jgi:hypothetical protein
MKYIYYSNETFRRIMMKRCTITAAVFVSIAALAACGNLKTGNAPAAAPAAAERTGSLPNAKRGVSYSFEGSPAEDMALLSPAVKWFYTWGSSPKADVDKAASDAKIAFVPMAWNDIYEEPLRAYIAAHPECEYLLAYNEPNLKDQANMTPSQAAQKWPKLVKIAKELKLKIVSPAMNYGTLENYGDPVKWLDEFFGKRGVSLDDISAIAIHCYMQDAGAMKWFIGRFKKYGKPIWMTEFCAWEKIASLEQQMVYMSEAVTYMELDPDVERYAWFIPKGREEVTVKPFNKLLTKANPPELTDLGKIFVNMGTCDKSVFVPAGQQIEAEHFTDCNVSLSVNAEGFSRPVHYRPSTDGGGLDICDFTKDKWVEYQVETAADKAYTLSLRNTVTETAALNIAVDGVPSQTVTLNQTGGWTTGAFPLQLSAGRHTIRLEVTAGDCALNWLKLE